MWQRNDEMLSTMTPPNETCLDSLTALSASPLNNKLPSETLATIFKYLPKSYSAKLSLEILTVSLVCINWQSAAELILHQNMFDDPLTKMRLSYAHKFLDLLRKSDELGVNYGCRVKYISLSLSHLITKNLKLYTKAEDLYTAILQLCRHARGIRIQGAFFHILHECHDLSNSSIAILLRGNSITEFEGINLTLNEINIIMKRGYMKNLRKVKITEPSCLYWPCAYQFLQVLAKEAHDLWYLELNGFEDIGIKYPMEDIHWPKLRYLLLPECHLDLFFLYVLL